MSEAPAETVDARGLDELELLKVSAELAELVAAGQVNAVARRAKRVVVVRLARRIVADASLTDEEAVKAAGAKALALLGGEKG